MGAPDFRSSSNGSRRRGRTTGRRSSKPAPASWSNCARRRIRGAAGSDRIDTSMADSGVQSVPAVLRFEAWRIWRRRRSFPRPSVHNFLLRYWKRTGRDEARDMVVETLLAMEKGGMHDQLGGGFHRYSVDEYWFVPHFEKMLYDQAQLVISYLEAFQITQEETLARAARRTLDYVMRDMTAPGGGFYSAEDADSAVDAGAPARKERGRFLHLVDAGGDRSSRRGARRAGSHSATAWKPTATFQTIRTTSSPAGTSCSRPSPWKRRQIFDRLSKSSRRAQSCLRRARNARARISTTRF